MIPRSRPALVGLLATLGVLGLWLAGPANARVLAVLAALASLFLLRVAAEHSFDRRLQLIWVTVSLGTFAGVVIWALLA